LEHKIDFTGVPFNNTCKTVKIELIILTRVSVQQHLKGCFLKFNPIHFNIVEIRNTFMYVSRAKLSKCDVLSEKNSSLHLNKRRGDYRPEVMRLGTLLSEPLSNKLTARWRNIFDFRCGSYRHKQETYIRINLHTIFIF
jgi:hypothetical protein